MPFTPGRIERAILDSKDKKMGEEGILHRVILNNKRYFAKCWRGKHYQRIGIRQETSIGYTEESNRSPVSPFWHKVKYYESALIHEAFPEHTIKISAGYDPRIIKTKDEHYSFDYKKGTPITVANEVPGESKSRKMRDEIIDGTYKTYFDLFRSDKRGVMKTSDLTTRLLIVDADVKMFEKFGEELDIVHMVEASDPSRALPHLIQYVHNINPHSVLIDFFESGLIPTHPAFNFIPTGETNEQGLQGVFIEVFIADIEKLHKKLLSLKSTQDHEERIYSMITRYLMYRALDDVYDDIFIYQNFVHKDSLIDDADIVNAVFQILNQLREAIEELGMTMKTESIIQKVRSDIFRVLNDDDTKETVLKELEHIKSTL